MTIPPGLTCNTCGQSLRHGWPDKLPLTRTTPEGIQHVTCPKACDCGTALKPTNRSGRCKRCRHRAEQRRYRVANPTTEPSQMPRTKAERQYVARPCNRCHIPTLASTRVCRDCRDVLSKEEVARWAS